ncbi:MAG: helix-turn-helix domain-containing protein [Aristaeellaceae bacterium]
MEASAVNPFVRYSDIRVCSASYRQAVMAYDYRLFAVLEGAFRLETEEGTLSLCKDCCVVIPPATAYCCHFDPGAPCTLCNINFSLSYLPGEPLPPDEAGCFRPERMPEQPDGDFFPTVTRVENADGLCRLVQDAVSEHALQEPFSGETASAMLKQALLRLRRLSLQADRTMPALVGAIARYLNEHCRETVTGRELGQMLGYHPFYLNRIFQAHTGQTMHRYQMGCRIRLACAMLESSMLSIREISDSLGFSTPAYFSETFRRLQHVTPTAYRRGAR